VPGVVPALAADDQIGFFREKIDDFTFSFIAPLGADENRIRHKSAVRSLKEDCDRKTPRHASSRVETLENSRSLSRGGKVFFRRWRSLSKLNCMTNLQPGKKSAQPLGRRAI
jgi:hypothetical protein